MTDVELVRIQNTDKSMSQLKRLMQMLVDAGREVYIDGDRCALMVKGGGQ